MVKRLKILSITMAAALMFSACGQKDSKDALLDSKNPISIVIWHYYNGPQKITFDNLVNEFNETVGREKGIVVEAFGQGNVTDLTREVMDAANKKVGASEIPDVFAAYADTVYQVDKMGFVAELDDYLTKEELDEYIPEYIDEGRFDANNRLKIFPTAKSTEILMLNKTDWDKFQTATGADIDDLKTFEGVTKVAEEYYHWTDSLTPEPNDGRAFFGRDAAANYFVIGCKELGVDIFDVNSGGVQFRIDRDIMKKLWDNYYIPYIKGHFASFGKFRSDDAKTGDIIALIGSTSGAAYFPDKVVVSDVESYPIEVITMEAPCFRDGELYAVQQGAGMVVTKSEPAREYASIVFLKWFTEEDRNIDFSVGSGYLPVKKAANDKELIGKSLSQLEDSMVSNNLKITLPVAVDTIKTHKLYTNKAFEGGTKARQVLEYSMSDKAKQDRETILANVSNGMSIEEAVATFSTEANFDAWLKDFTEQLEATIK